MVLFEGEYVYAKTHSDVFCGIGDACIEDEIRTMYLIECILKDRGIIAPETNKEMTEKINSLIRY